MRTHSFGLLSLCAVVFGAGCGPAGPPNLEGFGEVGETENDPLDGGDGDGDPGDGDGDPGDGDGDPGDCIDAELGGQIEVYHSDYLDPGFANDHDGVCGPTPGADYSMSWRAPQSGLYRAELWSEGPSWLTVLRGGCNGSLENCNAFEVPVTLDFYATAGQEYTFIADGEEFVGYFDFWLYPLQNMPGECPDGGELFDVPSSAFGSTWDASNNFGSACGGEDAPDRSYVFWPPISGLYEINTFGSNYDTMLAVYYDYCGFEEIDCNDDASDLQSQVFVELIAGQPYTIVVDGWGGDAGDYNLNINLAGGGSLCDDIVELGSELPAIVNWPSDFSSSNLFQGCSFASQELRFLWSAPADGLYVAEFDAGMAYSALSVAYDACGGQDFTCSVAANGPATIQLDAFAGQAFVFVTEWEAPAPPDLQLTIDAVGNGGPGCGQALPVGAPTFASGSTMGGGNQYSGSCSTGQVQEVEYWWTAPATGTYLFSLEGSSYDTLMYVRDGGCNGPELACNDDTQTQQGVSLWSSFQLDLVAGQTVSIFIEGYNGTGNYQLAITSL